MTQKHSAFCAERQADKLVVRGYLRGSEEVRNQLRKLFGDIRRAGRKVTVDASDVHATPEGLSLWIEGVQEYLSEIPLRYIDSQLADLVQLDDRYAHERSTFEGSDMTVNLPPRTLKLPEGPRQRPSHKAVAW